MFLQERKDLLETNIKDHLLKAQGYSTELLMELEKNNISRWDFVKVHINRLTSMKERVDEMLISVKLLEELIKEEKHG